MEENVTLLAAFGAGVLSFISPCVLPLIPGYLSYVSGLSLDDMRGGEGASPVPGPGTQPGARRRVVIASLAFILGFSLVFVSLGASASLIGQFLMSRLTLLGRIAGAIIIIFGLHTMGVFRIEWLYQDARVQSQRRPAGFFGAILVGIAFAFGWTPCIGPQLGAILSLAAGEGSVARGTALLAVYAAGLGIPFLLVAAFLPRLGGLMAWMKRHMEQIERVMGLLLWTIGLLMLTGGFSSFSYWLLERFPGLAALG